MSKRKPLEAVRGVRDRAVGDAARTLTAAERRARDASTVAEAARNEEAATRARAAEEIAREQRTVATARDLAQLLAFEVGRAAAINHARDRAGEAADLAREAGATADRSRAELGVARAALDVIEKHQERARKKDDREREARIDEVAEDSFAARFRKRT